MRTSGSPLQSRPSAGRCPGRPSSLPPPCILCISDPGQEEGWSCAYGGARRFKMAEPAVWQHRTGLRLGVFPQSDARPRLPYGCRQCSAAAVRETRTSSGEYAGCSRARARQLKKKSSDRESQTTGPSSARSPPPPPGTSGACNAEPQVARTAPLITGRSCRPLSTRFARQIPCCARSSPSPSISCRGATGRPLPVRPRAPLCRRGRTGS